MAAHSDQHLDLLQEWHLELNLQQEFTRVVGQPLYSEVQASDMAVAMALVEWVTVVSAWGASAMATTQAYTSAYQLQILSFVRVRDNQSFRNS